MCPAVTPSDEYFCKRIVDPLFINQVSHGLVRCPYTPMSESRYDLIILSTSKLSEFFVKDCVVQKKTND